MSILPEGQPKQPKLDQATVIKEKVKAIAATATPTDVALVKTIVETAKTGKRKAELMTISPAACALLFLTENGHNRDWSYATTEEYARRMTGGLWKWNNASLGFYTDGVVADAQHRLSGAALAGYTLTDYPVIFGMTREAIDTVDSPKTRDGATHAKLDGIQDASTKQSIVKNHAAYMVRAGDKTAKLSSASEVKAAIEKNDHLLDACIRIGDESCRPHRDPTLKPLAAATLAYLMLKATPAWPEQRVREKLAFFQSGSTMDDQSTPYFVAGTFITDARRKREAKDRLTGVKELGVAIFAMIQTELGVKSIRPSTIKAQSREKAVPDPHYPENQIAEIPFPLPAVAQQPNALAV